MWVCVYIFLCVYLYMCIIYVNLSYIQLYIVYYIILITFINMMYKNHTHNNDITNSINELSRIINLCHMHKIISILINITDSYN